MSVYYSDAPYMIALSGFNELLEKSGKETLELQSNEMAIFQDSEFYLEESPLFAAGLLTDLSRWDKVVVAGKIEIIKTALNRKEQIVFMYYFSNEKRGEQLNHTIWYSSGQVGMCGDIVPCGRIIGYLNWPV